MRASSDWIDRYGAGVRLWLVLGPSVVGFYPVTGLINPFWGSLSGWPLYAAARGHPIYGPHPWHELFALFAGPFAMLLVKIWLSGILLGWQNRWRAPLVVVWSLSAFGVVPFHSLPNLFPGWPVWCACE